MKYRRKYMIIHVESRISHRKNCLSSCVGADFPKNLYRRLAISLFCRISGSVGSGIRAFSYPRFRVTSCILFWMMSGVRDYVTGCTIEVVMLREDDLGLRVVSVVECRMKTS